MITDLSKEDILGLIEDQPLNPFLWRQVLALSQKDKDYFRSKAVSILIDGLERLKATGVSGNVSLNTTDAAVLLRLPVARNLRPILKELGRIALNELRDPHCASAFCIHALETGIPDVDCDALLSECNREIAVADAAATASAAAVADASRQTEKSESPALFPPLAPVGSQRHGSLASRILANSTALALARVQHAVAGEVPQSEASRPVVGSLSGKCSSAGTGSDAPASLARVAVDSTRRSDSGVVSGQQGVPPSFKTVYRTTRRLPASAMEAVAASRAQASQPPLEAVPAGRDPKATAATRGSRESIHVTETQHCKPRVSKLIVRTGKLSLIAAMAAAMEAEAQASVTLDPLADGPVGAVAGDRDRGEATSTGNSLSAATAPEGPSAKGSSVTLVKLGRPLTPKSAGAALNPLQAHQAAYQARKKAAVARNGGDFTRPLEAGRIPGAPESTAAVPAGLLDQATRAMTDGDFAAAEKLAREASQHQVDQTQALEFWTSLGQLHFQAGRLFKAAEAYRKAMYYGADTMPAWFNMALALQHTGQVQEALHHYMRADAMEKDHPKVWCNLGALYFQLDRFSDAEKALRKVVHIRPDYARAWDNLGAALAAQDKLVDAARACQQAVKHQPDFPEAWFRLGAIHFHHDDLPGAESDFLRARALSTITAYTHSYLAMIYARQGKAEQAEEAIRIVLEAETDKDEDLLGMAWSELAQMYLNRSEFEKAAMAYERAVLLRPEEFSVWFNLGLAHEHRHAWLESMIAYETASMLKSDSGIVWQKLANSAAHLDNNTATINALHRALELQPQDSDRWHELGLAYARCDMPEDSAQALTHADQLRRQQNLQIANLTRALEVARSLNGSGSTSDEEDELSHGAAA